MLFSIMQDGFSILLCWKVLEWGLRFFFTIFWGHAQRVKSDSAALSQCAAHYISCSYKTKYCLSSIDHLLLIINYRLSTIDHRVSNTNCRLSTIEFQLSTVDYKRVSGQTIKCIKILYFNNVKNVSTWKESFAQCTFCLR